MSVSEVRNAEVRNSPIKSEMRAGVMTRTLAGAFTVGKSFPPMLFLDPGGSTRVVTLPAEADSVGLMFTIVNMADAAEDLTIQDDATGAVATVAQNESAIVVCNGVAWRSLVGANT